MLQGRNSYLQGREQVVDGHGFAGFGKYTGQASIRPARRRPAMDAKTDAAMDEGTVVDAQGRAAGKAVVKTRQWQPG